VKSILAPPVGARADTAEEHCQHGVVLGERGRLDETVVVWRQGVRPRAADGPLGVSV